MKINYKNMKATFIKNKKTNQSSFDSKANRDNFFLASYTLLFPKSYLSASIELTQNDKRQDSKKANKEELTKKNRFAATLISEDEFMDLLPANSYFH